MGITYVLNKESLPAIEAMLNMYYDKEKMSQVLRNSYSRPRDAEWLTAEALKLETLDVINKLVDLKVPIRSLYLGTMDTKIEFDLSGMAIGTGRYTSGAATNKLITFFNNNPYNYPGAPDRLIKLVAKVGANLKKVSDNSIRKWLKGEIKIKEDDWLKMITVQSLQNSIL